MNRMNLNITQKNVSIDARLKKNIERKVNRLERHFQRITSLNLVLSSDKREYRAEATAYVDGNDLFAVATDSDLQSAVDSLANKLERQLAKHKEKFTRQ